MQYELKIYLLKAFSKIETKGSVTIYKCYERWSMTYKEVFKSKKLLLRDLSLMLKDDRRTKNDFKYTVRILKKER